MRRLVLCFLLLLGTALQPALAHKASDGYLQLGESVPASAGQGTSTGAGETTLRLSLAVKDLDAVIDSLDADNDRRITWSEIRQATPGILRWVAGGFVLRCGVAPVAAPWQFDSLEQRIDGAYVRLSASLRCEGAPLALTYSLMKDVDPTHRLIVSGTQSGQPVAAVLSPQGRGEAVLRAEGAQGTAASGTTVNEAAPQSGPATLAQFFLEGVHHIVTGYDHLAFLLALMLPISLVRRRNEVTAPGGVPGPSNARRGIFALIATVTGFTIGHSFTLVLATLGVINASPTWVEPAIAITIALSALLNLYPIRHVRGDVLALGFGMIHGLAFSSVMTEAGITGALLLWGLAGFNLGVEAGQLAGVAVWCCIHLALVRWRHYQRVVVRGGSWALLLLALYWAVERIAGQV